MPVNVLGGAGSSLQSRLGQMPEVKRPSPSGLSGSSGHGPAVSRSVPPGARSRGEHNGRPTTPSDRVAGLGCVPGLGRRGHGDDFPPRLSSASGGSAVAERHAATSPIDGRELQSSTGNAAGGRSRSVAAGNASRLVAGNADVGSRCSSGASVSTTCDKCDAKHSTERCPFYHKDRERHKDAWVNYGKKGNPHQMGNSGGNFVLRSARVMRQPGDGSCLFHSLCHGLQSGSSAMSLRRDIAHFLQQNPSLEIAGDTLEEWVRWDSNSTVQDYARRIAVSGWGGGIEMAACSLLKGVNVHVYESIGRAVPEFKRISCFDAPSAAKTIHVLYQGGVHYDALIPLTS